MGLLKTIITDQEFEVNQAYARIDTISGNKNELAFSLNYYKDQESFLQNKPFVKQSIFNFVPSVDNDSLNFIKQGYEYLKSLSEFETAIDA